ncbi:MAG: DUF5671 domain-containing protein [Candidatus Subteraquimicrobiales bacterium]|nr:DUF5671 domain-containing protein [Candidatus Subteraquimicrobiales bacterium]
MLLGIGLIEIFILIIPVIIIFVVIGIATAKTKEEKNMKILEKLSFKKAYVYLMSFVGLLMVIFGGVSVLNIIYKLLLYFAFPKLAQPPGAMPGEIPSYFYEITYTLPQSLAQLTIGLPVWLFHWKKAQKMEKEDQEEKSKS